MSYADANKLIKAYEGHLQPARDVTQAEFEIPPFLLFHPLGWGGMSAAFLAVDPNSSRRVVIKLPLPEKLYDAESTRLFQREQVGTKSLGSHDHIVFFDSHGTLQTVSGGQAPFLSLEFVAGRTLASKICEWTYLSQREVCRLSIEMCRGLQYIHGEGYTHRDIKPSNVLLDALSGECVRLVDLGLVIGVEDESDPGSAVCGTPGYIAPERLENPEAHRKSPQVDLFGLGCTMYEALTGERAIPSLRENLDPTYQPRWPSIFRPNLNVQLVQLVFELLSRDPSLRPDSAHAVEQRLIGIQSSLPFEEAHHWPYVSNQAIMSCLAQLGRSHLAPSGSDVREHLALTLGLVERLGISNGLHNVVRQFADSLLVGLLHELKDCDFEQVAKALVSAGTRLRDIYGKLVAISGETTDLPRFRETIDRLKQLVSKTRRELEAFAVSKRMPMKPEDFGDQSVFAGRTVESVPELERIAWSAWVEFVRCERRLVEDQLFVSDRLATSLFRIEKGLRL